MDVQKESFTSLAVFENLESEVRSYIRSFPTIFHKAKDYRLWDGNGRQFIDFFSGAGALNYGHNHPRFKKKLIDYISSDGITHSLDMATTAKEKFLRRFDEVILKPRGLDYKIMFPGPTGTNAVESALKLARKATGRNTVLHFTNAFHGMTLGSLSISGNRFKRNSAGVPLGNSASMPYDNYLGENTDTAAYIRQYLEDCGSGLSLPAAVIVETVQGEGGVNVASFEWLRKIEQICRKNGIVLIVDDVQMGCGRTGPFFSFEPAGIQPDMVCLSKSISGYGLPMSLTLIRRELDVWEPGEHNGTFRGHNLAFITATEALSYWENDDFSKEIIAKGNKVHRFLAQLVDRYPELQATVRGRGFIQGIECGVDGMAEKICQTAFEQGLLLETSGPNNEVMKLLPPLIIDEKGLFTGLEMLAESIREVTHSHCLTVSI
ncbi:diaminobutyrate--2-oxoglutarate transaminase [Alicyclobacillus pomorum]|uniref:diaminobutyrate--2-oxoglutarate transaminase n=1 Tax=Alicyclobacillus pomorum TaxID=204470 RepID=UPI0004128CC6|nr:diaminobutyrate--2-oxoglutarate transaminase [Alicyclobacillus pomorum]